MPRSFAPLLVLALLVVGCAATGVAAQPAASPATAAATRTPTFVLDVTGGPGAGHYVSTPDSTLRICTRATDGSWRAMYGGGKPWANIDLLVGPDIASPGHGADAALEITAGSGYLWIDQGGFRGGDAKGRSSIDVKVDTMPDMVTFTVDATTPNRTPQGDGPTSTATLTVTCPV